MDTLSGLQKEESCEDEAGVSTTAATEGVLTPEFDGMARLQQYQRDGFTVFPEFLTQRHLSELRDAFDERMSRKQDGEEVDLGCNWTDPSTAHFLRVLQDERLLDLLASTCGEPFVALRLELFEKGPGSSTTIPWHQDTFTTHVGWEWTLDKANDMAAHPLTLWVALDDVGLENGGMEMVPGRHHELIGGVVPEEAIRHDQRLEYKMAAGQAGLHHPLTPHRSCANQTNGKRRAFLVRFAPWTSKVEAKCGPEADVCRRARTQGQHVQWLSSHSGRYVWLPGNDETLSETYRLNRLLVCSRRSKIEDAQVLS